MNGTNIAIILSIIGATATITASIIAGIFVLIRDKRKFNEIIKEIETLKLRLKDIKERIGENNGKVEKNKEYLENNIKQYLEDKIKETIDDTNIVSKMSIDPNVKKILNHSEYIYSDIEYKNKISDEYKDKIDFKLMMTSLEGINKKIIELETEKLKLLEIIERQKLKIRTLKENRDTKLEYELKEKEKENENLKEKISELKQKNLHKKREDRGIER